VDLSEERSSLDIIGPAEGMARTTWAADMGGHSSAVVTANVYGHFIPRADDRARIEAAERALLAT
jgi:hypothetical protein